MKKKGFAVSAILYTMLLLFLVLLVGILNNLQNKKTVLDQLKTEVISSQIKTSVPVIKVKVSNRTVLFDLSDDFGLIGYFVSTTKKIPEEEEWIDLNGDLELTVEWKASEIGIYYVYARNILGRVSMKEYTIKTFCPYDVGDVWSYQFKNAAEEFVVPCAATYKLEAWGAGNGTSGGGYTTGEVVLDKDGSLYIYVGGSLKSFNGGGTGNYPGSGATDIRVIPATDGSWYDIKHTSWEQDESLLSRLITSGGAGGKYYFDDPRGRTSNNRYTGGYSWSNGAKTVTNGSAAALSDISVNSTLGLGVSGGSYEINYSLTSYEHWNTPSGGGGWKGGYGTNFLSKSGYSTYNEGNMQGEGTSVTNYTSIRIPLGATGGTNHVQTTYDKYTLTHTQSLSGNENMPTTDGRSTMTGNLADGFAKITLVSFE